MEKNNLIIFKNKKGMGVGVLISGAIAIVVLGIIVMAIIQFDLLGNLKYIFLSPNNLSEQILDDDARYYPECKVPIALLREDFVCFCSAELCSKCVPSKIYLKNNIFSISTGQINNLDIGELNDEVVYIEESILNPSSSKWLSVSNYFSNFEGLLNLNGTILRGEKFFCRDEEIKFQIPDTHKSIEIGYLAGSDIFLKDGTDTSLYLDGDSIYFKDKRYFGLAKDNLVGKIIAKPSVIIPYYYGHVVISDYLLDESTLPDEFKGQQVAATLKIIDGSVIIGNNFYIEEKLNPSDN